MRDLQIQFSADALKELDTLLKTTKDVRVFRRAQAVREVVTGQRMQKVSEVLHYPYSALRKWVYRFAQYGLEGLQDRPRAGRPRKVTPEIEELIWQLSEEKQFANGHLDAQWSCGALCNLVEQRTGVVLSRESIRRVLKMRPTENGVSDALSSRAL